MLPSLEELNRPTRLPRPTGPVVSYGPDEDDEDLDDEDFDDDLDEDLDEDLDDDDDDDLDDEDEDD